MTIFRARKTVSKITYLSMCLLISGVTFSFSEETPPLSTDRPDQTESTSITMRGCYQVETGAVRAVNDDATTIFLPGTLFRTGLFRNMELRFGIDGWLMDRDSDENGFGDSRLSAKIRFKQESGLIPEMALIPSISFPTGEKGYSSERYDPELRMAFAHSIKDNLSLGYNVAVSWSSAASESGEIATLASFPWSVSLGQGISDRIGSFTELYGEIPINSPGGPANSFDCGFTFHVSDNCQLDLEGGVGISEAADDWFTGAGVSYRIP
ncbi:transporter [bacterium]|nr:transporter [bacterium]